jgi:hypothetical protein
MKLTDPEIKAAKPKEKPYSLPDGHGLVMCQHFSGHKVKQHFAATRSQRAIYIH